MKRLLTGLGCIAMAMSIGGAALALNPQPLPPRCATFSHCPKGPGIRCPPPTVARQIKAPHTGRRVWRCIKLKID